MKTLIWYRNDLRIEDHEPLVRASDEGQVVALYCFDPRQFKELNYGFSKTESIRAQFLIESIQTLREKLREMEGDLLIRIGKPEDIIPDLVDKFKIDQLFYHAEVTSEEIFVEDRVQNSVEIRSRRFWGHEMYHPDDLPFSLDEIPGVFTQFRKKVEKKSEVRKPLPVPDHVDFVDINQPGEMPELKDIDLQNTNIDQRA
ncbi:MAG: cryptochrome DASH, partial [Bacteroidetes bacterium]|nr:cryptochrome DASH [Bacteroidota bacterium]